MKNLYTLSDMAMKTGIPKYKITYVYQQGYIQSPQRFNNNRMFTDDDVEKVKEHFRNTRQIAAEKRAKTRAAMNKEPGDGSVANHNVAGGADDTSK